MRHKTIQQEKRIVRMRESLHLMQKHQMVSARTSDKSLRRLCAALKEAAALAANSREWINNSLPAKTLSITAPKYRDI